VTLLERPKELTARRWRRSAAELHAARSLLVVALDSAERAALAVYEHARPCCRRPPDPQLAPTSTRSPLLLGPHQHSPPALAQPPAGSRACSIARHTTRIEHGAQNLLMQATAPSRPGHALSLTCLTSLLERARAVQLFLRHTSCSAAHDEPQDEPRAARCGRATRLGRASSRASGPPRASVVDRRSTGTASTVDGNLVHPDASWRAAQGRERARGGRGRRTPAARRLQRWVERVLETCST